jgi:hypothetical protein
MNQSRRIGEVGAKLSTISPIVYGAFMARVSVWDGSGTTVPEVVHTKGCNSSTEGIPKEGQETEKEEMMK